MRIRVNRFNIYLLAAVALAVVCGCQSAEKKQKKQSAIFRLHIESRPDQTQRTLEVPVYREDPIKVNIERRPFVTEEMVKEAKVLDAVGGFALQIQFDRSGRNLLEQYTAGNINKHLVVFSEFTSLTNVDVQVTRWLAAPVITGRISDGILTFTPDADRAEAEHLADGLNNVAKKLKTGVEPSW